ncbi:MAG: Maf family protein [Anaerolineae bacterium]|nr:Maf family protein [Anaerolineae bacterium]
MITWLNLPVKTTQTDVDETGQPAESPVKMAARLARAKSHAIQSASNDWILAADTVVDFEGTALGKPQNVQEAQRMLKMLRGQIHLVHTSVTLRIPDLNHEALRSVTTRVQMRPYTDVEIDVYIAGGDPMDKAGAYAIQHAGFNPVIQLDRCYANVVGLPLCAVVALLEVQGITLQTEVSQLCLDHFGYRCSRPDRGVSL